MATTRSARSLEPRHRWGLALAVAVLAHASLLLVDAKPGRPSGERPPDLFELEVLSQPSVPTHSPTSVPIQPAPTARELVPEAGRMAARTARDLTREPSEESAPSELPPVAPEAGESAAGEGTSRKAVQLRLGPSDLLAMARRVAPKPAAESEPSVGLLTEGLHALAAEKGLSSSSPEVSACYRAAHLAPEVGTAVFEFRTDSEGSVTGVRVLGERVNALWFAVADDLRRRLRGERLRLPEGTRGVVTRIRIDRGWLAEDLSARGRMKRGAALGQGSHAKDFNWDESTQAPLNPGRLSPALGVSSEAFRKSITTRVTLLRQVAL